MTRPPLAIIREKDYVNSIPLRIDHNESRRVRRRRIPQVRKIPTWSTAAITTFQTGLPFFVTSSCLPPGNHHDHSFLHQDFASPYILSVSVNIWPQGRQEEAAAGCLQIFTCAFSICRRPGSLRLLHLRRWPVATVLGGRRRFRWPRSASLPQAIRRVRRRQFCDHTRQTVRTRSRACTFAMKMGRRPWPCCCSPASPPSAWRPARLPHRRRARRPCQVWAASCSRSTTQEGAGRAGDVMDVAGCRRGIHAERVVTSPWSATRTSCRGILVSRRSGDLSSSYCAGRVCWDDASLVAAQPATLKRYRVDTRATLRRQIATFDRTPYYIVASCFAEQSNIQGCSSVGERFDSASKRSRFLNYRFSTRPSELHSTAEGLFHFVFVEIAISRFGADLNTGGLLAFRGADGQVDTPPKWRNSVASKPFVLVLHRMRSPLKRK